jgi:putative oxidoreductase
MTTDQGTLDAVLLAVRIAAGITLALHGYQKVFLGGRIPGTAGWFESLGMRPGKVHAVVAASTEILSGLGFALGLLTPLTAAGCVGIMSVAAWTHKDAFFVFKDGWEYNMILAVLYVLVATIGPGRWSLDNALGIADDLSGTVGLVLSALGLVAAGALLAVFWRPEPAEPEAGAAAEPQAG